MAAPIMQFLGILALFFSLIAVYQAEYCATVSDCTVTGCANGGTLVCDDHNQCTCKVDATCTDGENLGVKCTRHVDAEFCRRWYERVTDHNCECGTVNNIHCIDGQCTCGYPPNN